MKLRANVERRVRVTVTADVERVCAHYAESRASFEGSDEEFVRSVIEEEAYEFLTDMGTDGDGFSVREDDDDTDVYFLRIENEETV